MNSAIDVLNNASPKKISAMLVACFALCCYVFAQTVTYTASSTGGSWVVHITSTYTWSNSQTISEGYYSNGFQPDSGAGVTLITVATSDANVTAAYNASHLWAANNTYSEISANCGTAADAGASAISSIAWIGNNSVLTAIAVVASAANAVSSFFSGVYDTIASWFE